MSDPCAWFEQERELLAALERGDAAPPHIDGCHDLRPIGRGGQGLVFAAIDGASGERVAVKVLDGDRARFEREIALVSNLAHPNVVSVRRSGCTAEGRAFIVMEYVDGVAIDEHVSAAKLDVPATLRLFTGVCDAVHHGHSSGVIHRDLKPANVRVDRAGTPKVLDFGLAIDARAVGSTLTESGAFVGTLRWASPEQIDRRLGPVDARSDVFSLGVMLYQLLTADLPFESDGSLRDAVDRLARAAPPAPRSKRDMPLDVETIVLRSLAREPARRYQSAADLARDIRRHLAGEPIEARRDGLWRAGQRALRRYRIAATAGAIVAAVLFATTAALSVMHRTAARDAAQARAAASFLLEMLGAADPLRARSDQPIRSILDPAASRFESALAGQPEAQRDVALALGRAYFHLGDHDRAGPLAARALAAAADAPHVTEAADLLGLIRHAQGRFEEADALFEREVVAARSAGLETAVVTALLNLGNVRAARGRYDDAERAWCEALEIARRDPGRHADAMGRAWYVLGRYYLYRGRTETAEEHLHMALSLETCRYGESSPQAAECKHELAVLRLAQGRPDEAIALAQEAERAFTRLLGGDHPRAVDCLLVLATARTDAGDPEGGLLDAERALAIQRARHGETHPATARTLDSCAQLRDRAGDREMASALWQQSIAIYCATLGEDHPDTSLVRARMSGSAR